MHPTARTLVLAFCALFLAACGSDVTESGNPPPPAEPPGPLPPPPPAGTPDLGVNASLNGRRPFPDDNAWNVRIDTAQVDPNSDNLIAGIGLSTSLHPDWGREEDYYGIPYVVVAGGTAGVNVEFDYADESDPGPYPIPANPPIEGGASSSGDRHILIIDRDNWKLYELFDDGTFPLAQYLYVSRKAVAKASSTSYGLREAFMAQWNGESRKLRSLLAPWGWNDDTAMSMVAKFGFSSLDEEVDYATDPRFHRLTEDTSLQDIFRSDSLEKRSALRRHLDKAGFMSQRHVAVVDVGWAGQIQEALELATLGGARVLRRDDIGALAAGKAADFVAFRVDDLAHAGGLMDPVAALVTCAPTRAWLSVINGRVVVEDGQFLPFELDPVVRSHNQWSNAMLRGAGIL